jgi:hypothetical protein
MGRRHDSFLFLLSADGRQWGIGCGVVITFLMTAVCAVQLCGCVRARRITSRRRGIALHHVNIFGESCLMRCCVHGPMCGCGARGSASQNSGVGGRRRSGASRSIASYHGDVVNHVLDRMMMWCVGTLRQKQLDRYIYLIYVVRT